MPSSKRSYALVGALALCLPSCGGGNAPAGPAVARGVPGGGPAQAGPPPPGTQGGPANLDGGAPVAAAPKNPRPKLLSREDFAPGARDPFLSAIAGSGAAQIEIATPSVSRQRDVRMGAYSLGDLTLIAIARGVRGTSPRALFLASDGWSGSITQGEYFAREEVLLSSVNRDYVEVEVVDEELARSLNLETGKRRAIYLKNE